MRLFKFLLYFLALDIGITIAFCAHDRYDPTPDYALVEFDIESEHTSKQKSAAAKSIDWSEQGRLGKQLFKNNCASCHNKNMIDHMTGPALAGVEERWEGREALLYEWIKNAPAVIASGDPYAVELFRKWAPTEMNAFPNLDEEQIEAILVYIEETSS